MSRSPVELLCGSSWDEVLLTTYSLSLSFFEAHLLRPGLRKNGTKATWLVSDLEGYHASLAESQTASVGSNYRLVPVGLPKGVFHPKVCYLHRAGGDVLLIGSGNVTHGGFGRNLEMIESFSAPATPAIFGGFAQFLDRLRVRGDFLNPDHRWIDRFRRLALQASGDTAMDSHLSLVHSVDEPISTQLGRLRTRFGPAAVLRLLSPFFDPDGRGALELQELLAAKRLVIGVIEGSEDESTFPFPALARGIEAAVVDAPAPARRLHAKLIEVQWADGTTATLAGSINATHQSLCTCNNIEVGVLRVEGARNPERFRWTTIPAPKRFVQLTRTPAGLGSRFVLHATLDEAAELRGTMMPPPAVGYPFSGTLFRPDGKKTTIKVRLNVDGSFHVRLVDAEEFDLVAGLQLAVRRGSERAQCWVQNEWLLEVSRSRNVPTVALLRLLRGEAVAEDDVAFLQFLSEAIDDVLPSLKGLNRRAGERSSEIAEKVATASIEELAVRSRADQNDGADLKAGEGGLIGQLLVRLFGKVERDVSGAAAPPDAGIDGLDDEEEEDGDDGDDEEDDEDLRLVADRRRAQNALVTFRGFAKDRLRKGPDGQRRALANLWLLTELQFHLRNPDGLGAAERFAMEWIAAVTDSCRLAPAPDTLDERVVSLAAVLAANSIARGERSRLVGLHEMLANYGCTAYLAPEASPLFTLLTAPGSGSLEVALREVYAARTRRQEAHLLLDAIARHLPLPLDVSLLQTREGRNLNTEIARGRRPRVLTTAPGRSGCPNCYMTLPGSVQTELSTAHLAACAQCGTFLVELSNP